jgi:hypothetical protein
LQLGHLGSRTERRSLVPIVVRAWTWPAEKIIERRRWQTAPLSTMARWILDTLQPASSFTSSRPTEIHSQPKRSRALKLRAPIPAPSRAISFQGERRHGQCREIPRCSRMWHTVRLASPKGSCVGAFRNLKRNFLLARAEYSRLRALPFRKVTASCAHDLARLGAR